jgi:DNA-binding NtrC family response regulator
LNSTRWNRKQAAALLKIDYKALLYKMKKLNLEDNVISLPGPARVKAAGSGQ